MVRVLFPVLVCLRIVSFCQVGLAQDSLSTTSDTIRLSRLTERVYAYDRAVMTATDLTTSLRTVRSETHWQRLRHGQATSGKRAYWLRIFLENDTDAVRTLYGYIDNNQTAKAYLISAEQIDSVKTGAMVPIREWPADGSDQYLPLPLRPRQQATLYVRLANASGLLLRTNRSHLPRPSLALRFETDTFHDRTALRDYLKNSTELLYRSWLQGALLFWALFVGLIYVRYRQPIYGYYFLYVLAGCCFALLKTRTYTPLGRWISHAPMFRTHLLESVMWLGLGAYLFFFIHLLSLRQNHPVASQRLQYVARTFTGFGLAYALVLLVTNNGDIQQVVFWGTRYMLIPFYAGLLIWTGYWVRSPLTHYVLLGNGLMVLVGVLAWLRAGEVILKGVSLPGGLDNLFTVSFAVLLEIIVFALALAQRIQLLDQERQSSQAAYIDEIEQRTAYEKRLAEVEMLALRSQMNPHFLFNSLNTIEYFVLKGDEANAIQYLANFARLLRLTLNHSNEETIRLSEEITGLKLYLDLEATRLGDEFRYLIETDGQIELETILLPPMLLQPFVENAVWHGLRQSHRPDKRLWIRLLMLDDRTFRFEIEDNGIGRRQAAHLKSRSAMQRKSYGLDITRQRIELFNRNYPAQLSIQLIDLDSHEQTGTLIRMTYQLTPILPAHESYPD